MISTWDFSMPPKISKVIFTTVLQCEVLLFLVCRWLKCRILCDLHVSNNFWQSKELNLNHVGQNNVGGEDFLFYFLTCLKTEAGRCSRGGFLWPKAQESV